MLATGAARCQEEPDLSMPAEVLDDYLPGIDYLPGDRVLKFPATDIHGNPVDISSLIGKKTIVFAFWLNACDLCMEEISDLKQGLEKHKLQDRVEVFTVVRVNDELERQSVREMAQSHKMTYPIIADKDLFISKMFDITMVPSLLLVGADGLMKTPPLFHVKDPLRNLSFVDMIVETVEGREIPPLEFRERTNNPEFLKMIGKPAPDFVLADMDGVPHSLKAENAKKPLLLLFWHPACPTCEKTVLEFDMHMKEVSKEHDINVLSLSYLYGKTQRQDAATFMEKHDIQFPLLVDEDASVGDAYKIQNIPCVVAIDKHGDIIEIITRLKGPMQEILDPVIQSLD